jgi:hypothetical protein
MVSRKQRLAENVAAVDAEAAVAAISALLK